MLAAQLSFDGTTMGKHVAGIAVKEKCSAEMEVEK